MFVHAKRQNMPILCILALLLIAFQPCLGEELPHISISNVLNSIKISWPASATNFVLESTPNLRARWQPIYDLNTNLLTLPSPTLPLEAFRLRKGIRIDATMPSVPVGQTAIITLRATGQDGPVNWSTLSMLPATWSGNPAPNRQFVAQGQAPVGSSITPLQLSFSATLAGSSPVERELLFRATPTEIATANITLVHAGFQIADYRADLGRTFVAYSTNVGGAITLTVKTSGMRLGGHIVFVRESDGMPTHSFTPVFEDPRRPGYVRPEESLILPASDNWLLAERPFRVRFTAIDSGELQLVNLSATVR